MGSSKWTPADTMAPIGRSMRMASLLARGAQFSRKVEGIRTAYIAIDQVVTSNGKYERRQQERLQIAARQLQTPLQLWSR